MSWLRWLWRKAHQIATIYIDMVKDSYLCISIFVIMGGISSLQQYPTRLTSVVVCSLFFSIVVPMLTSSLILAIDRIEKEEGEKKLKKIWILIKTMSCMIVNPLLIINEAETLKEQLRDILDTETDEKVLETMDRIVLLEKRYANFVKTDLQLETVIQTTMQVVLLLLTKSVSPTTGGLENMFKLTSPIFLIVSIIWSLQTSIKEIMKAMSLEKAHFTMISKVAVLVFAVFSTVTKILANISYFAPGLGLFDLLNHWRAEQVPFAVSLEGKLNASNGDLLYLYNRDPIPWALIDRWTYDDKYPKGNPPHYTQYTGMDLTQFFILYFVINVSHSLAIFFVKSATSESFRKANIIKRLVHCIETSNICLPYEDWDVKGGTIREHRARLSRVTKEVLATQLLNKVVGILMFVPLIYTGKINIWCHYAGIKI